MIPDGLAPEGRAAAEALEGDRAEGPEIGPRVDRLRASRLLRAHVEGRPHEGTRLRRGGLHRFDLRNAEIEDFGDFLVVVLHEEDVRGLQIAVDDP